MRPSHAKLCFSTMIAVIGLFVGADSNMNDLVFIVVALCSKLCSKLDQQLPIARCHRVFFVHTMVVGGVSSGSA